MPLSMEIYIENHFETWLAHQEKMEFAQHPRIQRYPENNVLSKIDVRITTFLSNLPLTSIPFLTFIPFLFGHAFDSS